MGFTTSFRMGQLLQYSLIPPKRYSETDLYRFMVADFVNAVRDCLKEGGYAQKHDEAEKGGNFLVGYQGRLFHIHSDYQVAEVVDEFDACGCGEDIALGAMAVSASSLPEARLMNALEAAERFNAGVRGPFNIEVI